MNSNPFSGWNPPENLADATLPRFQVQEITSPLGQRNQAFNNNQELYENNPVTSTLNPVQVQNNNTNNSAYERSDLSTFSSQNPTEIENVKELLNSNPVMADQFRQFQQTQNSSL